MWSMKLFYFLCFIRFISVPSMFLLFYSSPKCRSYLFIVVTSMYMGFCTGIVYENYQYLFYEYARMRKINLHVLFKATNATTHNRIPPGWCVLDKSMKSDNVIRIY